MIILPKHKQEKLAGTYENESFDILNLSGYYSIKNISHSFSGVKYLLASAVVFDFSFLLLSLPRQFGAACSSATSLRTGRVSSHFTLKEGALGSLWLWCGEERVHCLQ